MEGGGGGGDGGDHGGAGEVLDGGVQEDGGHGQGGQHDQQPENLASRLYLVNMNTVRSFGCHTYFEIVLYFLESKDGEKVFLLVFFLFSKLNLLCIEIEDGKTERVLNTHGWV